MSNNKQEDSMSLRSFSSVFLRCALGLGFLSAVADRLGLWGAFGATECRVGEFLTVPGLHAESQLVCAGGNDSGAWDHRHWC